MCYQKKQINDLNGNKKDEEIKNISKYQNIFAYIMMMIRKVSLVLIKIIN